MTLPGQARIVIVGGGIAGCSTAYHLARLGERDVLLLEQGRLTCGTTWHAAGLIGQIRPNRTMTAMSKYGIELYATLEAETGLATGWRRCGSVNVARTGDRLKVLRKQLALARSFGVEVEEISPHEAGEHFPLMRTPMIAPTQAYDARPALEADEAAQWVLTAIRHRPAELMPAYASVLELLGLASPRLAERLVTAARP